MGDGEFGTSRVSHGRRTPFLGYQLAQGRDYSDATAARIDHEVEHMIAGRQEAVRQLLIAAREHLDMAEALPRDETVREDALMGLLGPRPGPVPTVVVRPLTLASPAA